MQSETIGLLTNYLIVIGATTLVIRKAIVSNNTIILNKQVELIVIFAISLAVNFALFDISRYEVHFISVITLIILTTFLAVIYNVNLGRFIKKSSEKVDPKKDKNKLSE